MKTTSRASHSSHLNPLCGNLGLALATAALLFGHSAQAASDTWSGATDGNWNTPTNWGTASPGAASGTTNVDTATVNSAGGGNTTIAIDSGRNLEFITFDTASAAAYTIGSAGANAGPALILTSGGKISLTSTVPNGVSETFNAPLSLAGNYTLENLSTGTSRLIIAGNITNTAASTLTLQGNGAGTGVNLISGNIIQGTGTLAVTVASNATNVWELSGANNYNGLTTVNFASSGSLTFSGTNVGTSGLTISKGVAVLNNATSGGIGSGTVSLSGGTLTTGAAITSALALSNAISFSNGSTISGANSITLNGDFTVSIIARSLTNTITGSTNSLTLAGNVYLSNIAAPSTYTLTLAGTGNTNITGAIKDSSVVVNSGGANLTISGTATLSGANTYSGKTTISTGTLSVGSFNSVVGGTASSNLGAPVTVANGTISIGSTTTGGTLTYTGSGETTDRVINFAGSTGGVTLDQSGTGPLKLTSDMTATGSGIKTLTLRGSTAGTGEIAGAIVETGGANKVTKSGTGTWTLSGINTYTGSTSVAAAGGTLQFAKQTSLYNNTTASWTAANIRVATGGTLVFNVGGTGEFTTGDVTTLLTNLAVSTNATTNGMAAGSALGFDTTNASGSTFTISNVLANTTGAAGGARGLTKLGTGTLVLSNTNTYTGATTVTGGTLNVSGSIASSATTVGTGATLALSGSGIAGAVTVNSGTFQLGTAGTAGAVTINAGTFGGVGTVNSLAFTGTSIFGPGNSPGTVTIANGGSLTLSSATTSTFQFTDGGFGVGTFDLVTTPSTGTGTIAGILNLDFTGTGYTAGSSVTFINLSSIAGTFSTVNVTGLSGLLATVNYNNGAGDVFVSFTAIPEPSTYALIGGFGTLLFALGYRLRARRALNP